MPFYYIEPYGWFRSLFMTWTCLLHILFHDLIFGICHIYSKIKIRAFFFSCFLIESSAFFPAASSYWSLFPFFILLKSWSASWQTWAWLGLGKTFTHLMQRHDSVPKVVCQDSTPLLSGKVEKKIFEEYYSFQLCA